jgi:putative hemolysin
MSRLQRGVVRAVERLTGQRRLKRMYDCYLTEALGAENFWAEMLRRAGIGVRHNPRGLDHIPREGPVVVVANHPFGLIDGFVICWLMSLVRPDFRILINSVLVQTPEAREHMLPVDFAGTSAARAVNLASRATALRHLAAGGAVVVFPSGGVSTSPDRLGRRPAVDAPWQAFMAQMLQRARCPVVPIHFGGQNSRLFQIASHVSQTLRVSLLAHEVCRRFDSQIDVTIGAAIPYAEVVVWGDRAAIAAELCRRTYALAPATGPG